MPCGGHCRVQRPNSSFLAKGMLNTSAPSRPQCAGNRRPSSRLAVFLGTAACVVCVVLCAGCVSFMRNWTPWVSREAKKTDTRAPAETPAPKDSALNRPKTKEAAPPAEPVRDGSRSSVKVSTKSLEADAASRGEKTDSPQSPKGLAADKKSNKEATSAAPDKSTEHAVPDTAKDKTHKDRAAGSGDDTDDTLDKSESFKKHDHVESRRTHKEKST